MFKQELAELKQRELALRLRNIELRGEIRREAQVFRQPLGWWGLAGGAAGASFLLRGLKQKGAGAESSRLARWLGFAQLGLRLANLLRELTQAKSVAPGQDPQAPPPQNPT
ncbi:hypothetical protein DBR47_20130 [Paucibacter sp. KBW04]|uniref:hypothetical protein n=1 Tax=Paucibacter sp. KBW04 TaxID=2153361 RepID=UPI000F561ED5|nr:hypothetical protein [Paucibacter sp. KBW04]RQO55566.1 hypothetical protein DBR47_20130 [Paucibacter sp. KBW04]